jgi:hypothetical protein
MVIGLDRLGIIALENERVAGVNLFCLFRHKVTESFYIENCDTAAICIYVSKNLKHLKKMLYDNNITVAVCTERFIEKFGEILVDGVKIAYGKTLYQKLIPDIVKKAMKISCIDKSKSMLAISEDDPSSAFFLANKLCADFKYITVISKSKNKASEISEKILDELGIPVIVAGRDSKIKCNVAIKTGANMPVVPKDTILIDACAEHTITRKNLINWVEVSVGHNLPFDIDSLSFCEAMQHMDKGFSSFKITGFKTGKNKAVFSF